MNSENSHFALGTISQIALSVEDLDRAVAFYRDKLGLKHLFSAPPGLAFFQAGEVRLMLTRPDGADSMKASSVIYFKIPEINLVVNTLRDRGVSFEAEPRLIARMADHELWMAFFRDSEHNLLALMCEKPLATPPHPSGP